MDKWLKSPWFIRVISLLLALLLFASVNLDDGTTRSGSTFIPEGNNELASMNNIPLQVYMNEKKYVVKGVPQNVTVTVEGPNSVVTKTIRQKSFDVFVDLEGLEPGTHTVQVQPAGIPNQLEVYIEPKTVQVTLEERATQEYEVEADFMNRKSLAEGHTIGEASVSPGKVKVTGSKTEVAKVSLVKAIVDVTGANDTITKKEAPVKVYDQQGNELNVFVEPSNVKVTVPIVPPHKEVPLDIQTKGKLPDGLSITSVIAKPASVTVYAPKNILDNIDSIDDIQIDLSKVTKDTTVELDVPLPSKAKKMEPTSIKAEINVENTVKKTYKELDIQVENLSAQQSITFIDPEEQTIELTVTGTEEDFKKVTKDDFKVYIDVEQFVEGEFNVPIQIDGPKNLEWQLSSDKAQVRIE